ncbi:MAG: peptidoglycan DD-metalloendopeptidase family protein [Bacteroidetes bacterium]|nr:peptidoglycan DD-metalloendopeptidase family protein [Bacteroidota bacterium]
MKSNLYNSFICLILFLSLKNNSNNSNVNTIKKNKTSLIKQKRSLKKKIVQIEKIIKDIKRKKQISLGQLNAIHTQLSYKKNLTNVINKEIFNLNRKINIKDKKITRISKNLLNYKKEYEEVIYEGSKLLNKIDKILFIFSSKSFNEMFMKLKYINQYNEFRRNYLLKIRNTKINLKSEIIQSKNKKVEIGQLLVQYDKEQESLGKLKTEQLKAIQTLNHKTVELKKELKENKAAIRKVEKLVKSTILKDINKEKKEKQVKTKLSTKAKPILKILKGEFAKFRGKLPWPVKSGFISQKFGTISHPILKNTKLENLGIDIQTEKGAKAYAVFKGIIKAVIFVPGMQQLVIIKHGNYHTVYTKLKTAEVKVGQIVNAMDPIGIIYTNQKNITELQFQIWRKQQKLNPQYWIKKT